MTREEKERISNRLVMNFGILLLAALVLLYVRSALSSSFSGITYTIILIVGIACLLASIVMFVLGKKNSSKIKNYSAIPFGVFVGSMVLYAAKLNIIPLYRWNTAVATLYLLMLIYFTVMAVITAIQLRKPLIKPARNKKKKK